MKAANKDPAIENVESRLTWLERSIAAVRTRKGLEDASRIFPKTRTVIFVARECGGDGRMEYFGDNIKYAYLSFCQKAKAFGVACFLLTDSERLHGQMTAAGFPCLPWFVPDWTAEHMRILLGAKVAVLCNIFYPVDERGYMPYALLRGARSIQMWHGIPLKEIGMESVFQAAAYHPRIAEVLGASGPFDVFAGSSAALREEWARRFSFRDYAAVGYPRTDVLFRDASPHDMINVDARIYRLAETTAREMKPFVLYTPTFRDGELGAWFGNVAMEAVANHCHPRDAVFCVNLHPFEGRWVEDYRRRYPRIHFVDPLTDIYPILKHTGIMITDYSSIAFDFLLCDRPVIFYRPDHADYIARSRPLIAGHERYVCGDTAYNAQELMTAIDAAIGALKQPESDPYRETRAALRQRLYDHMDGKAGERLNQLIMDQLAV